MKPLSQLDLQELHSLPLCQTRRDIIAIAAQTVERERLHRHMSLHMLTCDH